jgi:hypothetical protein
VVRRKRRHGDRALTLADHARDAGGRHGRTGLHIGVALAWVGDRERQRSADIRADRGGREPGASIRRSVRGGGKHVFA